MVEHSIGNGEVDSSILSGSTSLSSISENLGPLPAQPPDRKEAYPRLPVDKKDSSFGRVGRDRTSAEQRPQGPGSDPHERVDAKAPLNSEVCNGTPIFKNLTGRRYRWSPAALPQSSGDRTGMCTAAWCNPDI